MVQSAAVAPGTAVTARPFLKSAGGKTKLLPEILARLPKRIGTYYEPFLGGGAVFFALADEGRFERAVISDANRDFATAYVAVAKHLDNVICHLKEMASKHNEKFFYFTRSLPAKDLLLPVRAARAIYLNKTCFNGLYRVNKKGEFNVPFGDYKNPTICDEENLRAVYEVLRRNVTIRMRDFEQAVQDARRGDAVYFDPPYVPVSKTSNFTAYTKDGFGSDDQERLRNVADKLDARGVHVLISNADTEEVRELYDGFCIERVSAARAINSKGNKRGKVGELLISGRC